MKIVVLIKQVPDTAEERRLSPDTGKVDREAADPVIDEITERALELALTVKDRDKSTEVVVATMGPTEASKSIRKALSMGADSGIHILDDSLAGADTVLTGAALAGALRGTGADLVIAGNESTDGRAGMIPAMIAEHLDLPLLGSLVSADIGSDAVTGVRVSELGTQEVVASYPAILTVTERFEEARFPNFKGIMGAKRKPVATISASELGIAAEVRSTVLDLAQRPPRNAGRKIVDDGNAAAELVDFLAARRLI
ncbi:electron transfer flavoprotein subunit beta/FixA family protein [Paeniglutamicibacter sp. ABSL32-1]|uniref:electron transfer flavoprotein subunit beta/FixA family protein n=1 Tax=Paeniglutamicibacter quisquiliarum TaxID=2849498 RepID=UPI001C2DCA9C|nr:electron transfer flavoprotein subunit beta/FixA family protein [Paeniglutamicibacter quisquiliarum]MBV1778068.1 electron transfer flavoprotein subunit beta/FixA family protein [Paeniglutamicibacter quisquiliarum]